MKEKRNNDINLKGSGEMKGKEGKKVGEIVGRWKGKGGRKVGEV